MKRAFRRKLCPEEFNSRYRLNAHIDRQHPALSDRPKKQFKCNLCGYETSKGCHLIRHMTVHTGERPFKFPVGDCGTEFKRESNLKNHIKYKHSDERPLKCAFSGCQYTAKISARLITHSKLHRDDGQFACSECDFKTIWNNSLKSHRLWHHSACRDFKCGHLKCIQASKSSVDLKGNFGNQHEERNVTCDYAGCDKKYANASALKKQKKETHSTKRFVCSTRNCSYCTNKPRDLARHMIVHDGVNEKISCSIEGCQYKGKNSEALERHMRRHKTSLARPVSQWGRYAPTKKALRDHVKLRAPLAGPFQCHLCFQHFLRMSHLQRHCFVHTNEKPFACGHCEYAAAEQPRVKTHILSFHADIPFPFIVHLLDRRECLDCKLTLPTADFFAHCKGHADPVVMEA